MERVRRLLAIANDPAAPTFDNTIVALEKSGQMLTRVLYVFSALTSANTNMEAARSRIQDADFAAETTNLARSQILSQAAQAMLAQANQSSEGVLQLLR